MCTFTAETTKLSYKNTHQVQMKWPESETNEKQSYAVLS